ncbi:DUF986 family protein [Volucribacter amazonae]|uniref:DUF986 family protein n=1 Tax=Volucribacter amazonae TaxID=256731 RepID=UPI0024427C23|nr:DUF986 family protein [Volucribacter amazonae]
MINTLLFIGIVLFLCYALYDQVGMDHWQGKTLLKVRLKKRAKMDAMIFIALLLLVIYQSLDNLTPLSIYLLATIILLTLYAAFIRSPVLLLKPNGFFYGNIFISYAKIHAINVTSDNVLVIDLHSGKRLIILPEQTQQLPTILNILAQLNIIQADFSQILGKNNDKHL